MNGKVHIGFALFGLGRAGMIHANNIIRNPQARLKYIVDIDENKAKEFVESNLLETKVVPPSEVETVLNDPSVTAAVITTPTHLHEDLVVSSLKARKAVLCEKPVATTMEAIGLYFRLVSNPGGTQQSFIQGETPLRAAQSLTLLWTIFDRKRVPCRSLPTIDKYLAYSDNFTNFASL